ncbi:MAG TPA: helix-turn-helix transcriptional regulator [Chloroflexota bacterium]|jgi:transcriptional regulator with XRE-family HTH domain|nr:helix-turn-helix transcriptional regulator [Chloroflexota bacterium]
MIDQFANLEDGDALLPTAPLDLSARMREIRARQGLKQSEVARRMGLDPSIPSLWEQGKRLVPANRVRSLADALEVTVDELLDGITGAPQPGRQVVEGLARGTLGDLADERGLHAHTADQPLLRLLPRLDDELTETATATQAPVEPWVVAERPPLVGWIPDGWEPSQRVQDISPSLPDGYWLDPVRLERPSARQLLRARLCAEDQQVVGEQDVPGAVLAERIYRHCSKDEAFLANPSGGRLPLIEAIFRAVLAAEFGGLTDDALIEAMRERAGAVPVTPMLLRKLRDSVRPYPIRRVDRDLFSGRR